MGPGPPAQLKEMRPLSSRMTSRLPCGSERFLQAVLFHWRRMPIVGLELRIVACLYAGHPWKPRHLRQKRRFMEPTLLV